MRMKLAVLLVAVVACGKVHSVPNGAPDGAVDASPPVDADRCLPMAVTMGFAPPWMEQGPFELSANPTGGDKVWRASAAPSQASFSVPYRVGDRITNLAFDAYGTGDTGAGLTKMNLLYYPTGAPAQILVAAQDLGREAHWGEVVLGGAGGFVPLDLADGKLLVVFDVTEVGYYIGTVTATFQRQCGS